MEQRRVGTAEIDHEIVVEVVLDYAADIVFAKDLRIH